MKALLIALPLLLSDSIPASHAEIDQLITKSKTYWYNNRDSGVWYLNEALKYAQEKKYRKGEADALKGLGFLSHSSTQQLQYYTRALELRKELNDSAGIAISLLDIGTIYQALADTAKMLQYINESYRIKQRLNDYGGIALCLIKLGNFNQGKKMYPEALRKYKDALWYRQKAGDPNGIAYAHVNLGDTFLDMHRYDSAIQYATMAESEFIKANNRTSIPWVRYVQAKSNFEIGNFRSALDILRELEVQRQPLTTKNLLLMSEIFEQLGDFKNALRYQKLWNSENETARREYNAVSLRNQLADYEYKVQQAEENKRAEALRLAKNRKNNLQFLVIAILLTASFIAIIFLRKRASPKILQIAVFLVFIFVFEYLVVLCDPFVQSFGESTPVYLLLSNVVIALIIAPAHHLVDKRFRKFVVSAKS
jgi:tetratricopeptide (TPR) repeat protein